MGNPAIRGRRLPIKCQNGSSDGYPTFMDSPKTLVLDDKREVTVVVNERVPLSQLETRVSVPSSAEYRLEDLLRAGIDPGVVSVSGILSGDDPLDVNNLSSVESALRQISKVDSDFSDVINVSSSND